MSITQISKIQIRRGQSGDLPQLAEGELGFTSDTGEVYIGGTNVPQVQYRSILGSTPTYPYTNVRLLTEFDVAYTLSGNVYYHGALTSVTLPNSTQATTIYTFTDGSNFAIVDYSLLDANGAPYGVGTAWLGGGSLVRHTFKTTKHTDTDSVTDIAFSATLKTGSFAIKATNSSLQQLKIVFSARAWNAS